MKFFGKHGLCVLWALLSATLLFACAKPPTSTTPASASQPEDQATRYHAELTALANDAPPEQIAITCHFLAKSPNSPALSDQEKLRCRHASLAAAEISRSRSDGPSSTFARTPDQWVQSAISFGATESEIRSTEKHRKANERKVAAAEAKEEAHRKRQLLIDGAENRKAIASRLRDSFLDQGLDIKVRISGKQSERLTMTYALFSDVWSHRFEKEGIVDSFKVAGFERVDMTDDFDWHVYWRF